MIGPMEIGILWLFVLLVCPGAAVFVLALAWRAAKAAERIANVLERTASEGGTRHG
jgi:hypothetical protein